MRTTRLSTSPKPSNNFEEINAETMLRTSRRGSSPNESGNFETNSFTGIFGTSRAIEKFCVVDFDFVAYSCYSDPTVDKEIC